MKTNVRCPFCDQSVPCSVRLHIVDAEREVTVRGAVVRVEAELDPDVVEQFRPHLRKSHPAEYAQLEARSA